MGYIQLSIFLTDDLAIKGVTFDHNDTGFKEDGELLESIASTLIATIKAHKDSIVVQDLLRELGIKREDEQSEDGEE